MYILVGGSKKKVTWSKLNPVYVWLVGFVSQDFYMRNKVNA